MTIRSVLCAAYRVPLVAVLFVLLFSVVGRAGAQGWSGAFRIVPVSAPNMALEAVGGGGEGTVVSIARPDGKPSQQWKLVPIGADRYSIRPSYNEALALSVERGETRNGARIVLERDTGQPWQRWTLRLSGFGPTVTLAPCHAPGQGLDDLGGATDPGSKQDIWTLNPADEHLQWRLEPLAGATIPMNMPKSGSIREMTFAESKIFPGTRRTITVFTPAEYDGSKPACVYVRQDGYHPAEKGLLESLIAAKEIPVTVGVFVTSGELPPPTNETMGRRNRSFEYDGMGDNYVRFLTEEILPYVSRSLGLNLSTSGNDRLIAGGSSGGIAAFNAAWERPDAFSRVFAVSGSFVAFRGGAQFPTMVRKYEAKPIRVFLTTGTHDMVNAAGDWYLLDQEMDKALAFSGYDYVFRTIEGGHGAGWNENFADAMRFLWKGWPEPVRAGPSAPRVQDVILPGAGWSKLKGDWREARSPACNAKGEVFFVDKRKNRLMRIGLDGGVSVFAENGAGADGLCVGPSDEIYTVSQSTGKIIRYDPAGRGRTWATGIPGRYAVATASGNLYVSGQGVSPGSSRIWFVKDGHKRLVDASLKRATGLAIRPDRWLLSAADGDSKWVYSYQTSADGALTDKERFFWLHLADGDDDAGAESVCFCAENRMLVGTRIGVQVCADDGATQAILPTPDRGRVIGVCLGGDKFDTLFAFTGGGIWRRSVKVHAVGAFSPMMRVNSTPL